MPSVPWSPRRDSAKSPSKPSTVTASKSSADSSLGINFLPFELEGCPALSRACSSFSAPMAAGTRIVTVNDQPVGTGVEAARLLRESPAGEVRLTTLPPPDDFDALEAEGRVEQWKAQQQGGPAGATPGQAAARPGGGAGSITPQAQAVLAARPPASAAATPAGGPADEHDHAAEQEGSSEGSRPKLNLDASRSHQTKVAGGMPSLATGPAAAAAAESAVSGAPLSFGDQVLDSARQLMESAGNMTDRLMESARETTNDIVDNIMAPIELFRAAKAMEENGLGTWRGVSSSD